MPSARKAWNGERDKRPPYQENPGVAEVLKEPTPGFEPGTPFTRTLGRRSTSRASFSKPRDGSCEGPGDLLGDGNDFRGGFRWAGPLPQVSQRADRLVEAKAIDLSPQLIPVG